MSIIKMSENSALIETIVSINEKYVFSVFEESFDFVIHFRDLDEFKISDLRLIKYCFLLRNRDELVKRLESLNHNIDLYQKYIEEINSVLCNVTDLQDKDSTIKEIIKKPSLQLVIDVYYDYVIASGKVQRESDHFKAYLDKHVDIDDYIANNFPKVERSEYGFKNHRQYALENENYICEKLFLSKEELEKTETIKREKERLGLIYGVDYDFFIKAKREFFSYLDSFGLEYEIINPDQSEFIIVIEKTSYLVFGQFTRIPASKAVEENIYTNQYFLIVELNYNPFFDYNLESDSLLHFIYCKYLSFSTDLIHKKAVEKAKRIAPKINIERINNEWEGSPSICLVYELFFKNQYAYSIMITENIENAFLDGNQTYSSLLALVRNSRKEKKSNFKDMQTFGLSCDGSFVPLLSSLKAELEETLGPSDIFEDKFYSFINFYMMPINIKSKNRTYIESLKKTIFSSLNHNYLLQFDAYHYVNGHQKWKNEYLLYELCKELYGSQVIYQFRPPFLKGNKGQLSYDIYLSKYQIAIEYQGKQHFEPVDYFGGESSFRDLQLRDALKKKLSKNAGVLLIEITYKETVSKSLIEEKVNKALSLKRK